MKARDIISGWPRPRSTVNYKAQWWELAHYKYQFPTQYFTEEFTESIKIDYLYHRMQQAMVNEWFARYRLGISIEILTWELLSWGNAFDIYDKLTTGNL